MRLHPAKTTLTALCLTLAGTVAQADEVMDQVYAAVAPDMHLSCGGVLETYGSDEEKVAEVVRLMAMVSLYNRQIDIMAVIPDEGDREKLRDEFVEELEDACDDDPGMLLAGAVDLAVKNTVGAYD